MTTEGDVVDSLPCTILNNVRKRLKENDLVVTRFGNNFSKWKPTWADPM